MISIRGAFVVFPWHIKGSRLVVIFCASFLLAILTVAALPGAGTWAQAPSEIVEEFDNGMGDWEAIFADPPGSANWSVEKDEGGNAVLHYRGGDSFLKWLMKDPNPLPAGYTTITVGPGEYLIDHVTWTPISPVVSISTD